MSSSTITPLWGPQLPRLKRRRQVFWKTGDMDVGRQTRNGITLVEDDWEYDVVRTSRFNVDYISDTVRNPSFAPFRPKTFFDDGGPLLRLSSKWTYQDDAQDVVTPWVSNVRNKYGLSVNLISINDNGFFPRDADYPPVEDYTLTDWHATAFKRLRPDRPLLDLFTFIVELRDLVHLNFKRIREIKDIADWWLATNFGWKPLLSDIKKMYKAYNLLNQRLEFLISNNGKPIRSRATLYEAADPKWYFYDTTNMGLNLNTWVQWPGRSARTSSWRHRVTRTRSQKIWASGSFVMYLKDVNLPATRNLLAVDLLGLRPTPAVIWNSLPWTWLIDWFTNVGDILDNITASQTERCVAQYLYIMGTTTREYEWHGTDGWYTCGAKHEFVSKVRDVAHPYGLAFGSNLTPLQMSILAALGAQKF